VERYRLKSGSRYAVLLDIPGGEDGKAARVAHALEERGGKHVSSSLFLFDRRDQLDQALGLVGELGSEEAIFVLQLQEDKEIEIYTGIKDAPGVTVVSQN